MRPTVYSPETLRSALRVAAVAVLCFVGSKQLLPAPLPQGTAIEDMTWIDVQSAVQAGFTTVIIPTGGLEQNGPHMVIGKHDYIVREAAGRIAKLVSHTLVAPVVPYVPEGDYDPPTGHMRFPGTLGVTEAAFEGVLEGIARSLKAGGFKTICFIGDHGGSQQGQAAVAQKLTAEWKASGVRVLQIDAYYDDKAQIKRLLDAGRSMGDIGQHASIIDTSELMAINPKGVDLASYRSLTFGLQANGTSGDPRFANAELGAALFEMRVSAAASQIKALVESQ